MEVGLQCLPAYSNPFSPRPPAFRDLAAAAGCDGEHHHRFPWRDLGVMSIMPPRRGRPMVRPGQSPGGLIRGLLHRCWPRRLHGQRWQIETRFSMEKKKLGSSLRSRRYDAQAAEMQLRVITLNLMLERSGAGIQQSRRGSLVVIGPGSEFGGIHDVYPK